MTVLRDGIARQTAGLDFLWAEITGKCNLHCEHCYADSAPDRPLLGAMSASDWRRVIDEGSELGCTKIQFIGGEPTLHPELPAFIEGARGRGYDFLEVYTNGIHFAPRLAETFVRHRVNLAFSVYSHVPEVHDGITRRPGSFQKTMDSIRWAVESGLGVRIGIIEMQANKGHGDNLKLLLRGMGVSNVGVDRMRGIGRGASRETAEAPFGELCGQCWRGRLCVTADGEAFPCVFSRFCRVGSVRAGLRELLETAALRDFRETVRYRQDAARGADCEPFPCTPDAPPPPCEPDMPSPPPCSPDEPPCKPDCAPNACTPQIA